MSDEYTVDVPVRYRDLDTLNHVNNAVYGTYIEEARAAYAHDVLGFDFEEYNFVLAHLELSFERPVTLGETVTVAIETTRLGKTSATMTYDLRVEDETVATAETTIVFVDDEEMRPSPIPEAIRSRIVEFEGLED